MLRAACLAALLSAAAANQPDVLFPHYAAPAECGAAGCRQWTSADAHKFANASTVERAGALCAIPGAATGDALGGPETASAGPFCYCKTGGAPHWCLPRLHIPEQINLMYASADTVVVGFVTYELAPPTAMGVATLREAGRDDSPTLLTGVSHWLKFSPDGKAKCKKGKPCPKPTPAASRNYTMHFVKLSGLKPATRYTYAVQSGAAGGAWSANYTFRSARAVPATRIAVFGDMAVTAFNAVSNLLADCNSGRIDAFVLMGDHAYNLGQADDRRGDAYMCIIRAHEDRCCEFLEVIPAIHPAATAGTP